MEQTSNRNMITRLMFRLLPVQILLVAVSSANGIVSSYFASNYIGVDAVSAVGLFSPVNMLITSISTIIVGGSVILCGKYMGENQQDKMQNVFSLNLVVSMMVSAAFILFFVLAGTFDLTGFLTKDPAVRPILNRYILGQAIGVIPLMLGNSLASFLSLENKGRRTLIASVAYIIVNMVLNYLFIILLHMEALGLALASSLGLWVYLGIQAEAFISHKTYLRIAARNLDWKESKDILRIGLPGAASNVYQTARGIIVNQLLGVFVGSIGISAFAAVDSVMKIFWSIPAGMLAVSRMLFSVSAGEEDRQTLTDVMRVMFSRFIPIMFGLVAGIMLCAVPFTRIFFRDSAEPIYNMIKMGFRILPLCMPFSTVLMHFSCYGQISGKDGLVHLLSLIDGVVSVAAFTALLIPSTGMNSVYYANILNGIVTSIIILGYSILKNKRFPRNMDELMVIPEDFGVMESERMDLTIHSLEDVVSIAERVQDFCTGLGIDSRRAYLAGLSMEEMAGNVVSHGYTKDNKKHTIDIRVVHKDEDVILRIKDDCVPFNPDERQKITDNDDILKNIGIRMTYKIARDIKYQNILGLNVTTIRI